MRSEFTPHYGLDLLKAHQVGRSTIYQYPSKRRREANAYVIGLLHKRVFISDLLLDKFTKEEASAVLLHEIGHIKEFHLWIKLSFFLLGLPIYKIIFSIIDILIVQFPVLSHLYDILNIGYFIGYFLFFFPFVDRQLERRADRYVVQSGIEPEVLISALNKLAELNTQMMHLNKIIEKLYTHPSFEKRIKWLADIKKLK